MLILYSNYFQNFVVVCFQLPCIYSWRIGNVNTVIVSVELGKLQNLLKLHIYCYYLHLKNVLLTQGFIVKEYTCSQRESSYYTEDIVTWKQVDKCIKKETHEFVSEIITIFTCYIYLVLFM